MCPTDTATLPPPGTAFPEYGPPIENSITGYEVKEKLSMLYPGLTAINIIEDGSMVTEDVRNDRVRIFVQSNGIDTEDEDDTLGDRFVVHIPRVK